MGERAVRAKLTAAEAVGRTPSLREPRLQGGSVLWLEQRPRERGRTTLRMRSSAQAEPIELTAGEWNVRSRVHEYGGGAYALDGDTVVFVHDGDCCLWSLDLPAAAAVGEGQPAAAADAAGRPGTTTAAAGPRRLTEPEAGGVARAFADGLIDRKRDRWLGVMEQGERDRLVAVPLAGGEPVVLHEAADFCGYGALSPGGTHLAWVEWQQPFMPWERSQLWLGRFGADGSLEDCRPIAGSDAGSGRGVSVFQPLWAGADLVVANDRSGWWNLERLPAAEALEPGEPPWEPLLPMEAEFAQPQWVYGLRTLAWDGRQLLAAACRQGQWELGRLEGGGGSGTSFRWEPFALPFDDLAGLHAEGEQLVAIAGSPTTPSGLLEVCTTDGRWRHTPVAPAPLEPEAISRPEPLWFVGHRDRPTHAWYYPPRGAGGTPAPLLVRGHSGPTGMARTSLNLAIQFWTLRGWGVVDVNYGGSTGFGRAYRERLDGGWGVVDVADCAGAVRALVAAGRTDAERVAIEGSSAGGFTVLAALASTEVFRSGACRYAVTDLAALARGTHRFEARYLDSLIGPWPAAEAVYAARSPLQQAERIHCPVIFFQGLDDLVVPPEQTERMALALSERGVPVELHLYPGEGHGFRSSAVQEEVLEATEAFFRRQLALPGEAWP